MLKCMVNPPPLSYFILEEFVGVKLLTSLLRPGHTMKRPNNYDWQVRIRPNAAADESELKGGRNYNAPSL
jgi:hypothetical protein